MNETGKRRLEVTIETRELTIIRRGRRWPNPTYCDQCNRLLTAFPAEEVDDPAHEKSSTETETWPDSTRANKWSTKQ
ncbi:MAG TPA: hypothetical protein VNA17_01525 [Pyrinomonadaceae bacterium]|nr:hypothetical protein [Pyrinomonadaceae bacterium]